MKSRCKIKQRDLSDCGVSCLASVAAFYGLFIPIVKLRAYAGTDKQGTTIAGLIRAAEKMHFNARGVKAQKENLIGLSPPFIAHIVRDNLQHYIVIFKVSKQRVTFMDPADGSCHRIGIAGFEKMWSGILLLLEPKSAFQKADERVPAFNRYLKLLNAHKFILVQAVVASVIYTVLGLLPSIYIQKIVDHVLTQESYRLLYLLSLFMIASLILQMLMGWLKSLFTLQTGMQLDAELVLGYYRHLLFLPQKFFDSMQVGELMSRINDAVKIRTFLNNVAIEMVVNTLIIFFSLLLMFFYHPRLAFLVTAMFPCYALIYCINNWVNKKWQRRIMENAAKVEAGLVESLNTIRTVKRFGIENFMHQKIEDRFIHLLRSVFTSSHYNIQLQTVTDFLLKLISICMVWFGSYLVLKKQLTTGELLSFYSLLGYFTMPATSLFTANRSYQEAMIAGSRLFEIFDVDKEDHSRQMIEIKPHMIHSLALNDIYFSYGNRGNVFLGLTTVIYAGKATAVVGESGTGKSTLFALLQKIYTVDSGNIRLGDFDLKHVTTASVRSCIAIVPQEIELISGSIIENIALGNYEPDFEKVIRLSRLLGIDEFIENLPQHYHTHLIDAGMNLSGGQRQRIAIARALYREPRILLLDEAGSALDPISEGKIQQALKWYRAQGNTLIVIAHRLDSIKQFEQIKVLKDGRIIEEGTHDELMKFESHYKKLWREQHLTGSG